MARLTEVDQIKQLQARYFRFIDTKRWPDLRAPMICSGSLRILACRHHTGADAFVAYLSKQFADAVTVHQGHMPEITITGPSTATGIWAILDWQDFTKTKSRSDRSGASATTTRITSRAATARGASRRSAWRASRSIR